MINQLQNVISWIKFQKVFSKSINTILKLIISILKTNPIVELINLIGELINHILILILLFPNWNDQFQFADENVILVCIECSVVLFEDVASGFYRPYIYKNGNNNFKMAWASSTHFWEFYKSKTRP